MARQYKSYEEDFKKTVVRLYENGKSCQSYLENIALVKVLQKVG